MLSPRFAWTLGSLLVVGMAARMIDRVPVDAADRDLANLVAQVSHEVRTRYVDEIPPAKLKQMQAAAVQGMLSQLDPHTMYVPPVAKTQFDTLLNGTFVGIGVTMGRNPAGEIEVASPIEGGPAYAAGIETGDVFLTVDGESVVGLEMPQLRERIVGEPGTSVRITVRRYDNTQRDFTVQRRSVNLPTVIGYQRNADGSWDWLADKAAGVAYIRIAQFNEETGARVRAAINEATSQGAKALVLDVRFNGGGRLEEATTIADYFLDEGPIVTVKGRARLETVSVARRDDTLFRGPLAILVNGDSASASEILAGALADHRRAAVVGTRTYGKGSVQEVEDWGEDGALKITTAKWLLPSGRSLQRMADSTTWGVDPTIPTPLTEDEQAKLADDLGQLVPIPPRSHATTRPDRYPDRQLDVAITAVKAQMLGTNAGSPSAPTNEPRP